MDRSLYRRFSGLVAWLVVTTPVVLHAQTHETVLDQTHRGRLAAGDTLNSTDSSFQDDYAIQVERGWIISVVLSAPAFEPYVWIISPGEAAAVQQGSVPGSHVVSVTHTAETAGRFIVRANSNTAGETGDYTLQITAGPARGSGAGQAGAILGPPQTVANNLDVPSGGRLRRYPGASGVVYTSGSGSSRLQVVTWSLDTSDPNDRTGISENSAGVYVLVGTPGVVAWHKSLGWDHGAGAAHVEELPNRRLLVVMLIGDMKHLR
ncbi:MAG: hypothetical protein H6716_24615 [Polyangiaceae bacterium]|nr:hypothetical protein [Polyangiaceae bacterium]